MNKFVEFTHKGWFGLCPVIVGDPDGQCFIDARWDWLNFWLDVMISMHALAANLQMMIDPLYHPTGWRIRLTGRFKNPIRKPFLG